MLQLLFGQCEVDYSFHQNNIYFRGVLITNSNFSMNKCDSEEIYLSIFAGEDIVDIFFYAITFLDSFHSLLMRDVTLASVAFAAFLLVSWIFVTSLQIFNALSFHFRCSINTANNDHY